MQARHAFAILRALMKSLLFLLAAAFAFSLAGCQTAAKKECCGTGGACCADGKPGHKH